VNLQQACPSPALRYPPPSDACKPLNPKSKTTLPPKPDSFKLLDPALSAADRRSRQSELLRRMAGCIGAMSTALGPTHLLVTGAQRYQAQLAAMAGV